MKIGGIQPASMIDYPGNICAIVFTIGCNFRCPYCHNPELVDETASPLSEAALFAFLESRAGLLDAVTITGGEPTMHDDLLDFMRRIKALGFLIKLDTNGTNPDVVRAALAEGLVDYVAMDIKGPVSHYQSIVARPVDTERILESISLLRTSSVPYEFRTTVVKALLAPADFHAIGSMIAGAPLYYLQKFVPTKLLNPAFRKKAVYSETEFLELQQIMSTYVAVCHVR